MGILHRYLTGRPGVIDYTLVVKVVRRLMRAREERRSNTVS